MLDQGRGGFMDFTKYKDALVSIFWGVDGAPAAGSMDAAMMEAKALREMMMRPPEESGK